MVEGRYRWRHYQVLAAFADKLNQERKAKRNKGKAFIQLQKKFRQKSTGGKKEVKGILSSAKDWEMSVNLREQLRFLPETVDTMSKNTKQVMMLELTI